MVVKYLEMLPISHVMCQIDLKILVRLDVGNLVYRISQPIKVMPVLCNFKNFPANARAKLIGLLVFNFVRI